MSATNPRVFLSGRSSRRRELRGIAAELRSLGFDVVSLWHEADSSNVEPAEQVWLNADAIASCDILVQRAEPPGAPPDRGGRHVELGLAYGAFKVCCIVGRPDFDPPEHKYGLLLGVVRYRSWEECLANLADVAREALQKPGVRGVVWPEAAAEDLEELDFVDPRRGADLCQS